jgi:hypothetical protein
LVEVAASDSGDVHGGKSARAGQTILARLRFAKRTDQAQRIGLARIAWRPLAGRHALVQYQFLARNWRQTFVTEVTSMPAARS